MSSYKEQLAFYAKYTNNQLQKRLSFESNCLQIQVIDAMRYSLLDSGKRLRAALVLEFARLCHASRASASAFACAIEMVHAYSLIHDDLPCMDDDDLRRGKPSCHKAFGEANALLAGDGLLTMAFETAADAALPSESIVYAVTTLSEAAGVFGMIGGQVIDLASEGKQICLETLNTLYELKTGALLRASAKLGCIAGGADTEMLDTANAYAKALGLAFQITDDILDVVGTAEKLGKPIGSDQNSHKTTYVTLLGMEGAKKAAKEQVELAKKSIHCLDDKGFLLWMADMVLIRDH